MFSRGEFVLTKDFNLGLKPNIIDYILLSVAVSSTASLYMNVAGWWRSVIVLFLILAIPTVAYGISNKCWYIIVRSFVTTMIPMIGVSVLSIAPTLSEKEFIIFLACVTISCCIYGSNILSGLSICMVLAMFSLKSGYDTSMLYLRVYPIIFVLNFDIIGSSIISKISTTTMTYTNVVKKDTVQFILAKLSAMIILFFTTSIVWSVVDIVAYVAYDKQLLPFLGRSVAMLVLILAEVVYQYVIRVKCRKALYE